MKPALNFNERKGQTLVEFALLLPVLVLALVMIFDLGRAVYYYSVIFNAAREGARYGIAFDRKNNANLEQDVENVAIDMALDLNLQPDNVDMVTDCKVDLPPNTIGVNLECDDPDDPRTICVCINYAFTPATPLLASFLPGGQIELKTEAEMRTEY